MNKLNILLSILICAITATAQIQIGADIDGEATNDNSGFSVSISSDGNRLAVGARTNSGNGWQSGHTRVFENILGNWIQLGSDIDGEAIADHSGHSVSLSLDGNRVAIGAPYNDGNGTQSGHTRIYEYSLGNWTQIGSDINGEAITDDSGFSVSLSSDGNIVAIGAPDNDGTDSTAGHVRVYKYSTGSWTQLGSDIDGEDANNFSGWSVSLSSSGSRVAIGAPNNNGNGYCSGHVRIYEYSAGSWVQLGSDIDGDAGGDGLGTSVALSADGSTIAVGGPGNSTNGYGAGHIKIFNYSSGSWIQLGNDIEGEAGERLGESISLSGNGSIVAVGAPNSNGNGALSGQARIYQYILGNWIQLGSDIDGEASLDFSGGSISVSSSGKKVAIGAMANDGNGSGSGHTRVYSLSIPVPEYIPVAGLQVYYPLDTLGIIDSSLTGANSVGRDLGFFSRHWNAGSSYIPKTNRFGVPGGAMSYTQNIAQTPYSGVLGTESRSVSVWVKHKGYSSDPVFFQYGSQLAGKRFSGHVNYNCNGVGVGSAFSTTTNNQALDTNWHHIVYVLDTSQCSGSCSVTDVDVYVDGVMYPNCNVFNGSTAINTLGTFDLQFIFGNSTIADSNRLALDDFGMWDRPLTQDEILDLYSGSTGPKAVADLQACYYSDSIVSLNWTPPADTGGDFLGFVIYRADSLNDSFRVVDTLYDYVSTYLDTTPYIPANYYQYPNREPYRYWIKTLDEFGRESLSSDTIQNVVLEYVTQGASSLVPGPIWNNTFSDSTISSFVLYETSLWSGSWGILDTINSLMPSSNGNNYNVKIQNIEYNCAGIYTKYQVEHSNGCFSNIDSVYNEDDRAPFILSPISNTFTSQNRLRLTFEEPADSSEVVKYLIYGEDNPGYYGFSTISFDSVDVSSFRINNFWETTLSPSTMSNREKLLLVPEDSCGNLDLDFGLIFNSITHPVYLDVQYNSGDFQLDWNSRIADSGSVFYTIYEAKYNGAGPGSYSLVANTVDTSADMSSSDSYENYCYYVSATSSTSNFVMESNRVCVSFVGVAENDFSYNLSPNPSNGSFSININSGDQSDYSLELRNNVGQVVYRTTLTNGDNHVTLDQHLAKGSYILVLKDENSQAVKREVLILQ
ncbi:T9SS type A sorting domain-containing protein [Schleiferiaceae bacterium]|nr:T9SS type A sorting domain-containing protein [Schleiferiaceae bacterium]